MYVLERRLDWLRRRHQTVKGFVAGVRCVESRGGAGRVDGVTTVIDKGLPRGDLELKRGSGQHFALYSVPYGGPPIS